MSVTVSIPERIQMEEKTNIYKTNDLNDKSDSGNLILKDTPIKPFKSQKNVKECKDEVLKTRLRTLISSNGLSEPQFFKILKISRQHWYYISWGIWKCPTWLKVRISNELNVDSSIIFEK